MTTTPIPQVSTGTKGTVMGTERTDPAVTIALNRIQALAEHCEVFDVPALATVTVTGRTLLAQIWNDNPADLATALLAWADTLTEVRCRVWWPDGDDDAPHLEVLGELSDGTKITVFGRMACSAPAVFGPSLQPGGRVPINLDHLASLTRLGEVAA